MYNLPIVLDVRLSVTHGAGEALCWTERSVGEILEMSPTLCCQCSLHKSLLICGSSLRGTFMFCTVLYMYISKSFNISSLPSSLRVFIS